MPQDQLLDHQYDGIQEYDNPCPGWWHAIFWVTVLFSVVYFLFFHVGNNGWTRGRRLGLGQGGEMRGHVSPTWASSRTTWPRS